jgi:hypothetical protein
MKKINLFFIVIGTSASLFGMDERAKRKALRAFYDAQTNPDKKNALECFAKAYSPDMDSATIHAAAAVLLGRDTTEQEERTAAIQKAVRLAKRKAAERHSTSLASSFDTIGPIHIAGSELTRLEQDRKILEGEIAELEETFNGLPLYNIVALISTNEKLKKKERELLTLKIRIAGAQAKTTTFSQELEEKSNLKLAIDKVIEELIALELSPSSDEPLGSLEERFLTALAPLAYNHDLSQEEDTRLKLIEEEFNKAVLLAKSCKDKDLTTVKKELEQLETELRATMELPDNAPTKQEKVQGLFQEIFKLEHFIQLGIELDTSLKTLKKSRLTPQY